MARPFRSPFSIIALCFAFGFGRPSVGQPPQQGNAPKQRLQQTIDNFQVASPRIKNPSLLKFAPSPVLRYSDQTRNLLDAGVWRLGERGRPTALVTVELYQRDNGKPLSCEVTSLTALPFTLDAAGQKTWELTGTDLTMKGLADGPLPGPSERARLAQMRELARRFTVHEKVGGSQIECRLMPQPIDRYTDRENQLIDGAAFAFANGTNPEAGILLETDGKDWSFGAFRLSTAALFVGLDGKPVIELPKVVSAALPGPYIARVLP